MSDGIHLGHEIGCFDEEDTKNRIRFCSGIQKQIQTSWINWTESGREQIIVYNFSGAISCDGIRENQSKH